MNKNDFMKAMTMIDDDLMRDSEASLHSEQETTVSGAEPYRIPVWQWAVTLAASLLLVAGIGAAGASYLSSRGKTVPDDESVITASTETSTQTEPTEEETAQCTETLTMKENIKKKLAEATAKLSQTKESSNTITVSEQSETGPNETKNHTEAPLQTDISAAESNITAPPTSTAEKCLKQVSGENESFDEDFDIFQSLASLSYIPYTCDGIPEYVLYAPDGTRYHLNLSSGWVWRKTPDMPSTQEPEEGYLTKQQTCYLLRHGAEVGMHEEHYGR